MAEKKEELINLVGKANVSDEPKTLEEYSRDNSFVPSRQPRLVVKPKDAAEVQQIVKWANQTNATLVPVSSGPPHFRGDTVPGTGGSVIVDLRRMDHIISIDRRNRIAVIEPGVTYSQLQPELAKAGLCLSTPLLPRRTKSVVASLLEREPTLTPKYQWTLMEPLRCLEVVWGDGSKMWTGEAGAYSAKDIKEEQKKKRALVVGTGPGNVDYYRLVSAAQGTMGIVTWASVKCEILPQLRKLFLVPASKLEDLLDCAYKILKFRFGDEFLILNGTNLASILKDNGESIKALKKQLPPWVLLAGIAGRDFLPQERVEFQEKDIADIARQCGLQLMSSVTGTSDAEVLEALLNPSREPYWKLGYKGGCQDIFFLTNLNRTPEFLKAMFSAARAQGYPLADIGVYIQPQQQGVACHCEFNLPYKPGDAKDVARVQALFTTASEELFKQGAFFSRPYGIWADMVYNRDAPTTMLLKKVKGLFDPNSVLNPGKLCF